MAGPGVCRFDLRMQVADEIIVRPPRVLRLGCRGVQLLERFRCADSLGVQLCERFGGANRFRVQLRAQVRRLVDQ